jgi:hypothetical protein
MRFRGEVRGSDGCLQLEEHLLAEDERARIVQPSSIVTDAMGGRPVFFLGMRTVFGPHPR